MKVLLLGGTGAIGAYVAERLAMEQNEVVVTTRRQRPSDDGVGYIQGNARDEGFITCLLGERWDAIIDFMSYGTDEFLRRVNRLLDATGHYFFLSSARVYAGSEEPLTEDSPRLLEVSEDRVFLNTDEYALAKARQENALFSSQCRNWTIIRPYISYSSQRLQLGVLEKEDWLYRALRDRTIVLSNTMSERLTTLTHGSDVARIITALVGKDDAKGEVFNAVAPESIRWGEVLDLYLETLTETVGLSPKAKLLEDEAFLTTHPHPYQVRYDRMYDREFNNTKIDEYVDLSEYVEVSVGLAEALREFLRRPNFLYTNWTLEARRDRATREYANCTEFRNIKNALLYFKTRWFR